MQHLLPILDDVAQNEPALRSIGVQKDIHYFGATAKSLLNGPESTGMGFWSINPYVGCAFGCAYCYARYAHQYVAERRISAAPDESREELAALPPWLAFERRIFVKENAAQLLRHELGRRSSLVGQRGAPGEGPGRMPGRPRRGIDGLWNGELILIGTATDPYQPAERRFGVTRGVLEVLAEHSGLRIGITTKSALVTRDVDLFARIATRSSLRVHVSLITLDGDLARRIEPRAPTPEARLRTITRLAAVGIDTGVNIMPVLPGLTDQPAMLDALVQRLALAGASHVNACALRLQASARRRYLPFIATEFPHLAARYRASYGASHQVSDRYRDGLSRFLAERCATYGIRYGSGTRNDFTRMRSRGNGGTEPDAGSSSGDATNDGDDSVPAGVSPQLELSMPA